MAVTQTIKRMAGKDSVRSQLRTWSAALVFFVVMTVLTGVVYTLVCTGIAQAAFPYQANGSIIEVNGKRYGSELLAQQYTDDGHMWGRIMNLNTTTFTDADGNPVMWSAASNLSPASSEYEKLVAERVAKIEAASPDQAGKPIPSDLVTGSGSGLDPDISPAAAEYQVGRIAAATGKSEDEVRSIIDACTEQPTLGILGQARVNVLKVNLMLDGIL